MVASIMWQRTDVPGLDRAALEADASGHRLAGTALVAVAGAPYDIRYTIIADAGWRTSVVGAHVLAPGRDRRLSLRVEDGEWFGLDDEPLPELAGAVDVDLAFTPASNTLPIRRLRLDIGEAADITAAYVDFPDGGISPRTQRYERVGDHTYRYNDEYDLTVDHHGLVTDYAGLWRAVASG